jgi:prophage antirepressor-like protein
MQNELMMFEFDSNQIHVELINGEPIFLANDVIGILGLENITWALKSLEDYQKLTLVSHRSGQGRKMWFLNESGLYSLIFKSIKPEAKAFQKWVTCEVLPEIRRTGGYNSVFKGLGSIEQNGKKFYGFADVLNLLGYKKSGSSYKLQEKYPQEFYSDNNCIHVSEDYALIMRHRRIASTALKVIKARQLELPFNEKEVSHES